METLLLCAVVLLSVAICALGAFWFYSAEKAKRSGAKSAQLARGTSPHDPWEPALRASRDKI